MLFKFCWLSLPRPGVRPLLGGITPPWLTVEVPGPVFFEFFSVLGTTLWATPFISSGGAGISGQAALCRDESLMVVARVPRKERRVLKPGELMRLLEAAREYRHYLVLRMLVTTGMNFMLYSHQL